MRKMFLTARVPPSHFLSLVLLSALLSGCYYVSPVAYTAYSYAPKTPSNIWKSPKNMNLPSTSEKEKELKITERAIPETDKPLTLGEILDVALQNTPATMTTWAQARQAAAQYGLSQSSAFPTISLTANYERSREGVAFSNVIEPFYLTEYGPQASLSYTVFDFGQQRASSSAARHALYYANLTHNRQIQTVIQNVSIAYYSYLYQLQLLRSYEEDVMTAQVTLDAARKDLEAGVKNISDYLQAKTQWLLAENNKVSQVQQVNTSRSSLFSLMGLAANSSLEIEETPSIQFDELPLKDLSELVSIAEKERSDLLAAEQNLESSKRALTAAVRADRPTITYNLQFGRNYYGGGLNDGHDFVSTLSLNVPLFQGFYYQNSIRNAQAQKESAEAALRQAKLNVIQDITDAHTGVKVAYETLKISRSYLDAAKEQYDVAIAQYRMGTNTILDVVSAQSSLADARAKYAGAINQWLSSLATLNYAVGAFELTPSSSEQGQLCSVK